MILAVSILFKRAEEDEWQAREKVNNGASCYFVYRHVHPPLGTLWLYTSALVAAGLPSEAPGVCERMETSFWDWSEEAEKAVSDCPVCVSYQTSPYRLLFSQLVVMMQDT